MHSWHIVLVKCNPTTLQAACLLYVHERNAGECMPYAGVLQNYEDYNSATATAAHDSTCTVSAVLSAVEGAASSCTATHSRHLL